MARNTASRTGKGTFGATGAMPSNGKMISDIMKATGLSKQISKTASAIVVPLVLMTLIMLPAIAKALTMVSSGASLALIAFMGYKVLKAKGIMGNPSEDGVRKSSRVITPEELEARKARAYAFGNQQAQTATQTNMTVH